MRILMVSHYYDSHLGGVEVIAAKLFQGLADEGCEIVWAAADATAPPAATCTGQTHAIRTWNGIEAAIELPVPIATPRALWKLRREIAQADVVLLHDCLYLSNLTAFVFARRRGIPVICVQHIGLVPYKSVVLRALMRFANRIITRPMLRRAEQVVFYSDITKAYFNKIRYRRPPRLVLNGVDTDLFHPVPDKGARAALRKRFSLPESVPVALFAGRFTEKKGLGVLRHMAMSAPEIVWAFAGCGQMEPSIWGLSNVQVFHGLSQASLAELYRASDALVLPSVGEGFPLVIQEALASGLPIVCGTETATADEELKVFVRGVEINQRDDQQTAHAFLAALRDQLAELNPERAALARHEFAVSRYSWERTLQSYRQILLDLVPAPNLVSTSR